MLLAAKSVGYIDPKSGGSSGIYFAGLLQKLGIADEIKPKERLQMGGYVAELVAKGEAEIAVHQISEILPVKGVVFAGPLPAEIQSYTVYAAGLSATARDATRTPFAKYSRWPLSHPQCCRSPPAAATSPAPH